MATLLPLDPVKRGRVKLLALAAFFALPVVAGYVAYFFDLAPGSAANYGTLIAASPLPDASLQGADGRSLKVSDLRGKWLLLQFDASECNEYCERKLYFMRQVRKALGKDMGRVERVWVLTDDRTPKAKLLEAIEGTRLVRVTGGSFASAFPAEASPVDHIFVVDPLGNLMMRFPREPNPSKILKDMQRLMKLSGME